MIYLIRHGRTEANDRHLYCGSTDLPLSTAGQEELQNRSVSVPKDARFFTSGMRRTEETLALLFGNVPHEVLPGFREIDFGMFEMKSYEDLKEDPAYTAWITGDNERNVPPGGESGEQMQQRVLAALDALPDGNLVIVTHGGVIAAIMAARFPGENRNRYQWQPKPGGGYILDGSTYRQIRN